MEGEIMLFEDNLDFLSLAGLLPKENLLLNSKEGFLKGNMFKNEFVPYKDYKVGELKACSEQEAYLFKIMELSFAINDINLYLDLHPEDKEIYDKLKGYVKELCDIESEYTTKYGPLELTDTKSETDKWILHEPWEVSDSYYV
jgi:spore coat protein JB